MSGYRKRRMWQRGDAQRGGDGKCLSGATRPRGVLSDRVTAIEEEPAQAPMNHGRRR
jgi:hypothetical protein